MASAVVLGLAACAAHPARAPQPPSLRLSPALLASGAWSQRLWFEHGKQVQQFDALLEIDAGELRLVALAAQQEAFRLSWDGERLQARQARWMPAEFRAEWVLDDLQLALWSVASLRAELPQGWSLHARAGERVLTYAGHSLVRIVEQGATLSIEHPLQGYRLRIESQRLDPP